MTYNEFILIINGGSIFILMIFAALLLAATRFKGENGYAAAIIVLTTIPSYLYNICRAEQWYSVAQWFAPFSFSLNTSLMPLLWLFVCRVYDSKFKLKSIHFLHFIPTVILFVGYCIFFFSIPTANRFDFMIFENTGKDTLVGNINSIVVFSQMFIYFIAIFIYLHRAKNYIGKNFSQSEWEYKSWITKFMVLMASLFFVVFVAYMIWPRTDTWLIQILNVIVMSYLVYNSLVLVNVPQEGLLQITKKDILHSLEEKEKLDLEMIHKLEQYAENVESYLNTSRVYLNASLTLQDVAQATGISSNNLSKAINTILKKNFFELINGLRIEEAKRQLLTYRQHNLTIDAVAEKCGFNSRFSFNTAFKKYEGITPSKWASKQV